MKNPKHTSPESGRESIGPDVKSAVPPQPVIRTVQDFEELLRDARQFRKAWSKEHPRKPAGPTARGRSFVYNF